MRNESIINNFLSVYPELMTYNQIHLDSGPESTDEPPSGMLYTWVNTDNDEIVINYKLPDGTVKKITSNSRYSITDIVSSEIACSLQNESIYNHTPSGNATYTLPKINNSSVTNEILINVDMSNTGSVTFKSVKDESEDESENESENELEIKSVLIPKQGDKWSFFCEYIFGKWQVFGLRVEETGEN